MRSSSSFRLCAAAALLAFATSAPSFGEVEPDFQVNTYTPGHQRQAAVAVADSGSFVVVWNSYRQDGSYLGGVFGQRYSSSGTAAGSEFQINTFTTDHQIDPQVAYDGAGNFVVVWSSFTQDGYWWGIEGQRYDASGNQVGSEFQVNTWTTSHQYVASVAVADSGDFVVVWSSYAQDGPGGWGVFGQRFDATGGKQGSEFRINTYTTSDQFKPAVSIDGAGNFVVVWQSRFQDGSSYGVFGQRYDAAGGAAGSEFRVNAQTLSSQHSPSVASDDAGNFVVVWTDAGALDGSESGVFGRRFDSSGNALGSDFQVNSSADLDQRYPSVAADASGDFIVVWETIATGGFNIGGQRFDASGARVGSEFVVNSYTPVNQRLPAISASAGGKFVAAWQSDSDGSGNSIRAAVVDQGAPNTPPLASATATFDLYNQGRGASAESQVRAVVSDHESLATHTLGNGRDDELSPVLLSDLSCSGPSCTPVLQSGQSASYQAGFEYPAGGLGRLVPGWNPGNGAVEDDNAGTFTLTADADTDSVVSWMPGRYLWVVADSALDEEGNKIDECGQTLSVLLGNDTQKMLADFGAPVFGDMTHLIATFAPLVGSSGNDNPRLVVHFGGNGSLGIRLADDDSGENLIGDDDPLRFDTSQLNVPPEQQDAETDWATALAAAGGFTVSRIDFVLDDPGVDPEKQYRLDSIVVAAPPPPVPLSATASAAKASGSKRRGVPSDKAADGVRRPRARRLDRR